MRAQEIDTHSAVFADVTSMRANAINVCSKPLCNSHTPNQHIAYITRVWTILDEAQGIQENNSNSPFRLVFLCALFVRPESILSNKDCQFRLGQCACKLNAKIDISNLKF